MMGHSFREPCWAFGITDRRGTLVGAVVWTDYQHNNVELTMVGRGAFHKRTLCELFGYAFDELKVKRISFTVHSAKEDVISLCVRIGCRVEGRKRRYYEDGDAIILGMLKEESRFYANKHGRQL